MRDVCVLVTVITKHLKVSSVSLFKKVDIKFLLV